MRQRTAYASLLLLTTTLVAPAALAQVAPSTGAPSTSSAPAGPPQTSTTTTSPTTTGADTATPEATSDADQQAAEVSAPGLDRPLVLESANLPPAECERLQHRDEPL